MPDYSDILHIEYNWEVFGYGNVEEDLPHD